MHRLVVDSSKRKLVNELLGVLGSVGIRVDVPPAKDRRPMLRLPDGTWIHGRQKIIEYAKNRRTQTDTN